MFGKDDKEFIASYNLSLKNGGYGGKILMNTWHSLEVLEPSLSFEAKDGPYRPLSDEDILI